MTVSVTLQSSTDSQYGPGSISAFVDQLYKQRGSMRDVTDESLREQIANEGLEEGDGRGEDDASDENEGEDLDARLKRLGSAREEMLNLVGEASNEVLMLQDFMSLLVSRDRPQAARTMSAALQEMVQPGSFGFDRSPPPVIEQSDVETAQQESDAIQFQSINATADRLLDSANSLEREIDKEVKYWDQILSVSEKGWNVTKIRGSSYKLGVRYSCLEAAPQFHARGLASLKITDDGNLTLDRGTASDTKALRVRVVEHGKVTETSSVPELLRSEDSTLDELVNQGRDSLFDEELHYELVKEGRQLIAYGVGVASGTITIAVPAPEVMNVPRMLLIDLVDREESIFAQGMLAPAVGQYLKLGLNHIYRQRYRRRTTVPTPLSKKRSAEPQGSTLLQSILCLAQHRQAVLGLQGPLKHLNASMLSAGLDSTYETDGLFAISPQVSSKQRANKRVQKDAVDSLFSNTLGEQSSTCSLGLPSSQRLLVHVHTDLSGPLYGTKYNIERVSPTTGIEPVARDVDNGAQAMKTLYEAVPRFILQHLAAQETAWSLHRSAPELSNVKDPRKRVSLLVSKGAIGLVTEVEGPEAKACIRCTWDGEHIDVAVKDGFDKLQSILSEIVESHEP